MGAILLPLRMTYLEELWGWGERESSYVPGTGPQLAHLILSVTYEAAIITIFILQMTKQLKSHGIACLTFKVSIRS